MEENALTFGMSTEEFWFGHPQTFYSYADVYVKKQEEKATELDYLAWRMGLYTMLGINQCLSIKNSNIFPKKPFCLKEEPNETIKPNETFMGVTPANQSEANLLKTLMRQGIVRENKIQGE